MMSLPCRCMGVADDEPCKHSATQEDLLCDHCRKMCFSRQALLEKDMWKERRAAERLMNPDYN